MPPAVYEDVTALLLRLLVLALQLNQCFVWTGRTGHRLRQISSLQ